MCRRIEKEFRLQRAADQLALAAAASTRPDDPTVIELLQQFDERYPGSREIAGAWLLHAKTLTDRLRQDQAASALFFRVIETYPAWPEAREARQYLAVLKQMAPPREGTPGAGDLSP